MKKNTTSYPFLRGGGEMGELTNNYDWASTPVGAIDQWPQNLRNTVSMILSSKFPMFLWWGEDLIQFYNDAYRPSLGNNGKHPQALGQKAVDCWEEIWNTIYPLIQKVRLKNKSAWSEDLLLPIYRNGAIEDVYWTFSFSAITGDDDNVEGVLVVCNETTEKVKNLARIEEAKNELEFAIEAAELGVWDYNPTTNKFTGNLRLKNWFGISADGEILLSTAVDCIIEQDQKRVSDAILKSLNYESGGNYDIEYTIKNPVTNELRTVRAKGRAWFGADNTAYRFNGTLQDITERKKAQKEIAKANHLTNLSVKSAGIGVFNIDLATGNIEYTPSFALILTGDSTKKEISRQAFIKHIHPDDLEERAIALKEGVKTNEFYYSPRIIWDDGTIHRMVVMGSNIFDASGNPVSFSGTVRDITVFENQKLALAEADIKFRNVTNSSPTGLWLSDTEGRITYINKTLIEWSGISHDGYTDGEWINYIFEDDRELCAELFQIAIADHSHYEVIFRLNKANGKTSWCRAAGDPYYNNDGSFAGYAGYCMDINEIIEGRKALMESEERFRSMIEEAPVATCLFMGRELRLEIANEIMLSYWNVDNSVMGLPLAEAVPELKGQPFLDILDEVFTTGVTYQATAAPALLNIGGIPGTYYFDFTYKPLFNAKGEVYAIMDMAIDVTEQVRARQKIENTQTALTGAIELAELATWSLDIKKNIFNYSIRYMNWMGITENLQTIDSAFVSLPEEFTEEVSAALKTASTKGSSGIYENVHPVVNRITGEIRIIHSQAQVVMDAAGNPEFLSGSAQDITKERKLQQELEFKVEQRTEQLQQANSELAEAIKALQQNNQELRQFAYIASHDLQEPTRKISIFSKMLKESLGSIDDRSRTYLNKINNSADRMGNLIQDVLAYSQLSKETDFFVPVDLDKVAKETITDFELSIEQSGAVIICKDLPVIDAIPRQMSQLFSNLISNSLKYKRVNVTPKITITAELLPKGTAPKLDKEKEYYRIEFMDNGIGFHQDYAEKIFDIFQRLHGKSEYSGTGIGLSICKKIIQNHHGHIEVRASEDIGALFVIMLPVTQNPVQD